MPISGPRTLRSGNGVSVGAEPPRLTPHGAGSLLRQQERVDSSAIVSVGASPGRDATSSGDGSTPQGVAVPSESPRPSSSLEPIFAASVPGPERSRDWPSQDDPRKGPCAACRSTRTPLSAASGRTTVLGVPPSRHQCLPSKVALSVRRVPCSPSLALRGSGADPSREERLALSQGPAADPGDGRDGEPLRSRCLRTPSSLLRARERPGTPVTEEMIKSRGGGGKPHRVLHARILWRKSRYLTTRTQSFPIVIHRTQCGASAGQETRRARMPVNAPRPFLTRLRRTYSVRRDADNRRRNRRAKV